MIKLYNSGYRGDCTLEHEDQKKFVKFVRELFPDTFGRLIVHIRNEGRKSARRAATDKAQGQTKGASDIIIPARTPFVCEIKRRDKSQTETSTEQIEYLYAADKMGAFACIAYGYDEAVRAFDDWRKGE